MKASLQLVLIIFFSSLHAQTLFGADTVFSGPQPGEKTSPFKVLDIITNGVATERDPITANSGKPTVIVFLHAVERSLVPLLKVVDEYSSLRKNLIQSEMVFLNGDRIEGEQKVKAVRQSLKLFSRTGLSLDGAEGPGNYGLNKECMMTIVTAKDNRVESNFALVQPGIADAPKVLIALAKVCGDTNPPTVESLSQRGAGRPASRPGMSGTDPVQAKETGKGKDPFPGAVPTDPTLNALLRQFIRPTNDVATVDRVLSEMQKRIKDDKELEKQLADGFIRVFHFGDRYGTVYARETGKKLLGKIQGQEAPKK